MNNMKITERDIYLLLFIFSNRGCKRDQIINKFFGDVALRTANARLKTLTDFDYLVAEREAILSQKVYYITKKCLSFLKKSELVDNRIKALPRFTLSGRIHDLDVIDIRIALEADNILKISDWTTEYELALHSNRGIINIDRNNIRSVRRPDGLFTIKKEGFARPFILEYIRERYGKERLYKILNIIEYQYPFYSVLLVFRDLDEAAKCLVKINERGRWLGKYIVTFKDSIIENNGLSGAVVYKGNQKPPEFKHWKEVYTPLAKESLIGSAEIKQNSVNCNKESENY